MLDIGLRGSSSFKDVASFNEHNAAFFSFNEHNAAFSTVRRLISLSF
jgi:hypothetical protein